MIGREVKRLMAFEAPGKKEKTPAPEKKSKDMKGGKKESRK